MGENEQKKCKNDIKKLEEEEETIILKNSNNDFYKVSSRGRLPRGRKTYPTRYHCKNCNVTFRTNIGAMMEHTQNHKNDFTKIYAARGVRGGNDNATYFRPQERQWNNNTGKTFAGSDASFYGHVLPKDLLHTNGSIFCRKKCDYRLNYNETMNA